MALVLQGSLLVRFGDEAVADAFCASRLGGDAGRAFGTLPAGTDFERIIERHAAGMSPNPERVTIAHDGGVADVRLTRADKHNALDPEMFRSLDAALERAAAAPAACARWSSPGDGPSFCAGLDFPSFMEQGLDISQELFSTATATPPNFAQRVTYDWQRLPVPVIGALHGNCIGGGAQLALGPDIRIAAPDIRISILEVKYGLIPDMGISPEPSPPRRARRRQGADLDRPHRRGRGGAAHRAGDPDRRRPAGRGARAGARDREPSRPTRSAAASAC